MSLMNVNDDDLIISLDQLEKIIKDGDIIIAADKDTDIGNGAVLFQNAFIFTKSVFCQFRISIVKNKIRLHQEEVLPMVENETTNTGDIVSNARKILMDAIINDYDFLFKANNRFVDMSGIYFETDTDKEKYKIANLKDYKKRIESFATMGVKTNGED